VRDVTHDNFGFLIAYVVPGLVVVWSVGLLSPTVAGWLGGAGDSVTVGGFLYVTIASVAAGMMASAVRWLAIDSLHHATGIPKPDWDFGRLQEHHAAFQTVVEHQYRHYQFYSNVLVSLLFAFAVRRLAVDATPGEIAVESLGFAAVMAVCLVTSRDNLRKYYARTNQILSARRTPAVRAPRGGRR